MTDFEEFDHARLRKLAYRITGSISDAEDIVQDGWLRWHRCDRDEIVDPARFINQIVANLSLDKLRRNKRHREIYVGSWLPEPAVSFMTEGHCPIQHHRVCPSHGRHRSLESPYLTVVMSTMLRRK
ncbi:MAG: sigma factor [Pseudomonadota bacterium]